MDQHDVMIYYHGRTEDYIQGNNKIITLVQILLMLMRSEMGAMTLLSRRQTYVIT